jgi:hypothetical protein
MFNGKVHTRVVSSSGKKKETTSDNKSFLKEQRIQRAERLLLRKKESSCIIIQSIFRKYLVQVKIFSLFRNEFDNKITDILKIKTIFETRNCVFSVPLDVFSNILRIFFFFCPNNIDKLSNDDHIRFNEIQKLFIESVSNQNSSFNIVLSTINNIQINNNLDIPMDKDKSNIFSITALQKENYLFISYQIIIKKILTLSIYKIINQLINVSIISTFDPIELSIQCLHSLSESSNSILSHANQSNNNNNKLIDSLMNCLSRLISTQCCHGLHFILTNNNENSLMFSKISIVLLSIIERSIQEDLQEFKYCSILGSSKLNIDKSWNNMSSILLTIPDIQNISQLKPFLSTLQKNNCYGWIRCLSEFYDDDNNNINSNESNLENEKIISSSTLLLNEHNNSINKSSFLGNFCQCVLKSEELSGLSKSGLQLFISNDSNNNIIWMSSVLNVLNIIPLLSLLRHIEERSDDSLKSEEIEENSFLLASGIKRLEYRLLARQRLSRKNELQEWNKLHNQINGLESIIRVYSDSSIIPTLIDLILPDIHNNNVTSSSSTTTPLNNTIKWEAVFNFINIYTRILISFPSYLDTTINKSKTRISISLSILNSFSFSRNFTIRLWNYLNCFGFKLLIELISTYGDDKIQNKNKKNNSISLLQECSNLLNIDISILRNNLMNILYIFCITYSHQLSATDDEEFFSLEKTLGNEDNSKLVLILKTLLHRMYFIYPIFDGNSTFSDLTSISEDNELPLLIAATTLFNSLYSRNERRPFLDEISWHWDGINSKDVEIENTSTFTFKDHLVKTILTCIPQVLPFKERLLIFQTLIDSTREDRNIFSMLNHSVSLTVRRDKLIEDSYNGLQSIDSSRLKGRIQIQFTNEQGLEEAGIDGGGLFKAFIDEFSKTAYDPSVGFFLPTSHQLLTPNPSSSLLGESHLSYFNYIGKMLGKAIFDVSIAIIINFVFIIYLINLLLFNSLI